MIPDLTDEQRARYISAMRDRQRSGARPKSPPTTQAPSSGPCGRCGIPGSKGCDHYLPLGPRPVPEFRGKK